MRPPVRSIQSNRIAACTTALLLLATQQGFLFAQGYPVVDTGTTLTFSNSAIIDPPQVGDAFYGQDGQHHGNQPSYTDNGDGTVSDNITGLMWVQARGVKKSWETAVSDAALCDVGGYSDWRMPTIKELYSLILFTGYMGMTVESSIPFIDTSYFGFAYGDEGLGERFIDCQDWTATENLDLVMDGQEGVFGVNFADGRIKCYPKVRPGQGDNVLYARYVRGNAEYGLNNFSDNGDGTITDSATNLMWSAASSDESMNWQAALAWAQARNQGNYLGYGDWRLPNIKELQSLADYSRAPGITESPAIDPLFEVPEISTNEFPYYWSSTTHVDGPSDNMFSGAAYVSFGRALGWMEFPPNSGNFQLLDVHGAGAQRSDPKMGDPANYPHGHGPQGDVIRIFNYVRLVRDLETSSYDETRGSLPQTIELAQNVPNPFNASTVIRYSLPETVVMRLAVFDALGRQVAILAEGAQAAGIHHAAWSGQTLLAAPSGVYFYRLNTPAGSFTRKMVLVK